MAVGAHLRQRRAILAIAVSAALAESACSGGMPVTASPPPPSLKSIALSGIGPTATVGQTAALVATATYSDGSTAQVTNDAAWDSSNNSVASVSSVGMVEFKGAGDVDLKASYRGMNSSMHVSVTAPEAARPTLIGVVTDADSGRPIAGVTVTVVDGPNANRSTQSDGNGYYSLGNMTPSAFTIGFQREFYTTTTRPVGLFTDQRIDVALKLASPDVSAFFGRYNVGLTVTQQTCEFPVSPAPTATLDLAGRQDGSGFTATMTERGVSRTYSGRINADGSFSGRGAGLIPGSFDRLRPQHDFSGTIQGRVTGRAIGGTETLTYGAPCPGKIIYISFSGGR
jgi:hypothetical protein